MSYSLWVMAATCLAWGAADTPVVSGPPRGSPPPQLSLSSKACCETCESDSLVARLVRRIRRLSARQPCATPCCETVSATPAPIRATTPLPVQTLPDIAPVAARSPYAPIEISQRFVAKVGRGNDYGWITGQLFYIHADGGLWVLRYAPIDKEDRYGGSVVLAPATSMDAFQDGDLVTVHGEILYEGRASKFLGGPLYRAAAVNLNERSTVAK